MESIERVLRDKSFFLSDAKGRALPLTVEGALGLGLNDFRGWLCAIGVENLHISPDGNIYGGACRNNGHLGNVFERRYEINRQWHSCTRRTCSCGADMQIRKVKKAEDIPKTYEAIPTTLVEQMSLAEATVSAPIHQDMHNLHPLTLTWDLGRRCNFSCSYCQPAISNNYEAHRSMGSLMFAWEGLDQFFLRGKKAKIVFTGGEPTINPAYLDFVKHIRSEGHFVHTTTNGSRLPEYFADLMELSFIGFSYHMEFAKLDRFVKVLEALVERKRASKPARDNWAGIRIMVPPGQFPVAKAAMDAMLAVDGMKEMGILVGMSACYDLYEHTELMPYHDEEMRRINEFA